MSRLPSQHGLPANVFVRALEKDETRAGCEAVPTDDDGLGALVLARKDSLVASDPEIQSASKHAQIPASLPRRLLIRLLGREPRAAEAVDILVAVGPEHPHDHLADHKSVIGRSHHARRQVTDRVAQPGRHGIGLARVHDRQAAALRQIAGPERRNTPCSRADHCIIREAYEVEVPSAQEACPVQGWLIGLTPKLWTRVALPTDHLSCRVQFSNLSADFFIGNSY